MPIAGDPSGWQGTFPDGLVPKILDLILEAWGCFPQPSNEELEPRITRRFRHHLIKAKKGTRLPFRISREACIDDAQTGEELGRIDIEFSCGYDEGVYFAVECKKLNIYRKGRRYSQARGYIMDGLMRFVDGRYAGGLDKGAMLGYVMDGRVDQALTSVNALVRSNWVMLQMAQQTGLLPSSLLPANASVRETAHHLGGRHLTIHHVFAAATQVDATTE